MLFLVLYVTAEEQQRMKKLPGNMEIHSIKESFKTYGIYVIENIPRLWLKKKSFEWSPLMKIISAWHLPFPEVHPCAALAEFLPSYAG